MARNKKAPPPASSVYPPTPATGRGGRASSIFPYSVERPPTGFTTPPVPRYDMNLVSPPRPNARHSSGPETQDPFYDSEDSDEEGEPVDTRETPVYARSDWGGTTGLRTDFGQEYSPGPDQLGVPPVPKGGGASGGGVGDDEEEIIDTRETPTYARSDWGATTGLQTAFGQDDFPGPDQLGIPPVPPGGRGSGVDGPKTIWSRSSYHSQEEGGSRPALGDDNDDVYTGQAPETGWTRGSYHPQTPAIASTPLPEPPTPSPPPRHPARSKADTKPEMKTDKETKTKVKVKSRHSVKNQSYGSALKRAGSRKASELVDISEMSEDSHSRHSVYSPVNPTPQGGEVPSLPQGGNPFSPVFAAASQATRYPNDGPDFVPLNPTSSSGDKRRLHRSTLPSILDLEHLGARSGQAQNANPTRGVRPHSAGPGLVLEPPTFPRPGVESPRLLTPEAQNRLGRMSVATARYSLPPRRSGPRSGTGSGSGPGTRSRSSNPDSRARSRFTPTGSRSSAIRSLQQPSSWVSRLKNTGAARWYRTWRVFLSADHAVMAALLMVIALADPSSGLGFIVKIQSGGLGKTPADGVLGLGVSEWCQVKQKGRCSVYATGDFQNDDESFKVPNNSIIETLYPLWTALASILVLQALFTLSTAFLHFYLFYILGIPFNHLATPSSRHEDRDQEHDDVGVEEEDLIQKEVDIRARCERPPFEEYIWLWWAWWAFRRGPVGHVYGLVAGGLGIVSFGLGYRFKTQLSAAAGPDSVSLGMGGVLPLIVFAMLLDPFVSAVKYFIFSPRRSFHTFLNPPDPTPAAVLLPQAEKPLARRRRATGLSTFYAPPTAARFTRGQTLFDQDHLQHPNPNGNEIPPHPPSEYDDETRRWLAEYPKDPELVPLINDLRSGGHNDDFLLSEVGLLYLRPDEQDPNGPGAALLVPPNGVIRAEVLEDAHIGEAGAEGGGGGGEHKGYLGMMSQLGEVFWWVGMEEDVERFIAECSCSAAAMGSTGKSTRGLGLADSEMEDKSMYTGVTGWSGVDEDEKGEHALAADMAIAMRRAEEDARKKWEA